MKKILVYIKEIVIIFALAFILAFLIKTFVIDNRVIPTPSMEPTVPVSSRILVNRFMHKFQGLEFGDIIVFKPTDETKVEVGSDDDMLKRVIGLPKDKIEIKDGQLLVNDQVVEETYIAEAPSYNYGPIEVPEDCIFVLGDNRNKSFDSHAWSNPFVPIKNVKGRAFFIYWPISEMGRLN